VLSVEAIDVFIQSSHILRRVSLEVREGEVVCLVGRNGAGKSTTLRTIMGFLRPRAGRIRLRDEDIHGRRTHEIARRGLAFSPEDSGIFPDLTVAENIEISTWTRPGGRPTAERIERAYEVFPVLRKYRARKGPEMSGGERKMLSVARALALDPAMLLLDEPFEGLSPAIVPSVSRGLAEITQRGHAILLAESNIYHVPDFATRLYVIERGEIIFNVFRQKPIDELFEQAKAKGVALIVRLPLASGLLAGKYTRETRFPAGDHRNYNANGEKFNVGETFAGLPFEKAVDLTDRLKPLLGVDKAPAGGAGVTMADLAMRWILDHDAVTTVIPGASRPAQAESNVRASDLPQIPAPAHKAIRDFYQSQVKAHIRGPY